MVRTCAIVGVMTDRLDSFFGALADPTRRAVLERLAQGPASVSELHRPHAMALPTFMRHLKVLEDSGVVRSVKRGRVRTCQLETEALITVQGWLAWQRAIWENRAPD
jgi:DNA-binding transcriptional ArsR family regulator